jgi:outer membrane autotransporter protein
MDFTGFSATANGEHDAWQYLARADAGYPLALGSILGDTVLTPITGLAVSRLEERAYTENGGNGAALRINAVESTSVKSTLGIKLARSLDTSWGEVTPQVKLAWQHEFADVAQNSASSYVAGGSPFSTPGVHQPRDGMLAGLGLTLASGTGFTLSANYDVEVKTDYVSQAGRLRFRSEF